MKEVGYPTIFSASETTLFQLEGPGLENRLSGLCPRLDKALRDSRDHVARNIFLPTVMFFYIVPSSLIHANLFCKNESQDCLVTLRHDFR